MRLFESILSTFCGRYIGGPLLLLGVLAGGMRAEEHWSFLPIERPPIPTFSGDWAANPIDALVRARLEDKKLRPARSLAAPG